MLIQLLIEHPQALGPVLQNTPKWVFGLFAALAALGLSQVRTREIGLMRMILLPLVMSGLSLWGMASAFRNSSRFEGVLLVWAVGALLMVALLASRRPCAALCRQLEHAQPRPPLTCMPPAVCTHFLARQN